MTVSTLALVSCTIFANALASVLLKSAASHIQDGVALFLQKQALLIGCLAALTYAASFLAYALVLRTLPVSKAYLLITFGAQAVLFFVGVLFLGEKYEPTAWIGVAMVIVGMILVARGAAA